MRTKIIIATDENDLNAKLEAAEPLPANPEVHFSVVQGQFGPTYFVLLVWHG